MTIERQSEILQQRHEEKAKEREIRIKKHFDKKNLFLSLISAIKKGDELLIAELTNKIPRSKLGDFIWKLGRYRYKTFSHTAIAISQIKWRRGF